MQAQACFQHCRSRNSACLALLQATGRSMQEWRELYTGKKADEAVEVGEHLFHGQDPVRASGDVLQPDCVPCLHSATQFGGVRGSRAFPWLHWQHLRLHSHDSGNTCWWSPPQSNPCRIYGSLSSRQALFGSHDCKRRIKIAWNDLHLAFLLLEFTWRKLQKVKWHHAPAGIITFIQHNPKHTIAVVPGDVVASATLVSTATTASLPGRLTPKICPAGSISACNVHCSQKYNQSYHSRSYAACSSHLYSAMVAASVSWNYHRMTRHSLCRQVQ